MTDRDFDDLFARTTASFDLSDEVQRRQAYQGCLDYVNETLGYTFDANIFLARAAEKLEVMPAVLGVVKAMVKLPDDARILLTYTPQGGPDLTANPDGLRYLSELCRILSEANSPHEHVHLYPNEPPMQSNSFGLTLYNEPSTWFDDRAEEEAAAESNTPTQSEEPTRRAVKPAEVVALGLFSETPFPPFVLMTGGRLYRIQKQTRWKTQKVTSKPFRDEDKSRMIVWTLQNDAQKKVRVALDLDDPEIRYFTAADLRQVQTS